jgi:hypothetical protein
MNACSEFAARFFFVGTLLDLAPPLAFPQAAAQASSAPALSESPGAFWPEDERSAKFDALWGNAAPRHADLLAFIDDPRGVRETHCPAPGVSCPLCGFPTFVWADADALPAGLIDRITLECPTWSAERGLCGRCREAYEALTHA